MEIAPNPSQRRLCLKSCGLVGEIPKWISNQMGLRFLDLSKTNLRGELPEWFVEMRFGGLILSDNEFTGSLSPRLFPGFALGFGSRVALRCLLSQGTISPGSCLKTSDLQPSYGFFY